MLLTAERLHAGFLSEEKLDTTWTALLDLEQLYKYAGKPQEEINSLIKARKLVYKAMCEFNEKLPKSIV